MIREFTHPVLALFALDLDAIVFLDSRNNNYKYDKRLWQTIIALDECAAPGTNVKGSPFSLENMVGSSKIRLSRYSGKGVPMTGIFIRYTQDIKMPPSKLIEHIERALKLLGCSHLAKALVCSDEEGLTSELGYIKQTGEMLGMDLDKERPAIHALLSVGEGKNFYVSNDITELEKKHPDEFEEAMKPRKATADYTLYYLD